MDLRLALYELAAQHKLDARATEQLQQLAGLRREPAGLSSRLALGMAVLAVALVGLGVIFWVAANWADFGRFGRFALLQGFVFVTCAAALWQPKARVPLSLLALLGIGALFAFFGQTYQTGADPWQLFALWAALSLPLCLAARSDALWTAWSLVLMSAISLWLHAHAGNSWRARPDDLAVHAIGWGAALALTFVFSPQFQRSTGAGPWALRTTMALTTGIITVAGLASLFGQETSPQYWLALLLLLGAGGMLSRPKLYDIFGLSAFGLGLNTLLIAGLADALNLNHAGTIAVFLITGLAAAALLSASVIVILRLSRRMDNAGASA
jgi:uncharacterized membrane protein